MKIKVFLVVVVLSLLFCGCGDKKAKYKKGDVVIVKLDGRKGVILYYNSFSEEYLVRFSSDSTTQKVERGIISDTVTDRKVLYVTHCLEEYEIELANNEQTTKEK